MKIHARMHTHARTPVRVCVRAPDAVGGCVGGPHTRGRLSCARRWARRRGPVLGPGGAGAQRPDAVGCADRRFRIRCKVCGAGYRPAAQVVCGACKPCMHWRIPWLTSACDTRPGIGAYADTRPGKIQVVNICRSLSMQALREGLPSRLRYENTSLRTRPCDLPYESGVVHLQPLPPRPSQPGPEAGRARLRRVGPQPPPSGVFAGTNGPKPVYSMTAGTAGSMGPFTPAP